ncbi:MAG TPA: SDR family oxidoreductase [Steroidobacteraceae bacterium]|nr:SDR family oxidoreductase [Steroidobacteraceae bacterium]
MKASEARVLITGGAGGIGSAVARELLARGAAVLLVGRDGDALSRLSSSLAFAGERVATVAADLTLAAGRQDVVRAAAAWRGGVNVLMNNAGVSHFGMFEDQSPGQIDLTLAVNVQAPLQLCHAMLPQLLRQPEAVIINTGSVFGAIGYPGYAVYSATKHALRGFTEALRRELAGTNVRAMYVAPRATRTSINSPAVERMNAELGVATDTPESVAAALCDMLESGRNAAVLGWPEKLFARLNAVLPGLVDRALRKQLPVIRRYASERATPGDTPVGAAAGTSTR